MRGVCGLRLRFIRRGKGESWQDLNPPQMPWEARRGLGWQPGQQMGLLGEVRAAAVQNTALLQGASERHHSHKGYFNATGFAGAVEPCSSVALESSNKLDRKQAPTQYSFLSGAQSLYSAININSAGVGKLCSVWDDKTQTCCFLGIPSLLHCSDLKLTTPSLPLAAGWDAPAQQDLLSREPGSRALPGSRQRWEAASVLCEKDGKWPLAFVITSQR